MAMYLVQASTQPAVSLDDMKVHLRVDHDEEDELIAGYIDGIASCFDGRDGWLGRALVSQTWDMKLDHFAGREILIPLPPLIEVLSITYADRDGAAQTLPPDAYAVVGAGGQGKGRVALRSREQWPVTDRRAEAVTVRFRAGYVDTQSDPTAGKIPAPIVVAIKREVASVYKNRESVIVGAGAMKLPSAVEALLAPYRVW